MTNDKFVNPYTFVPLPEGEEVARDEPGGHSRLAAERYSGRIAVTAQARTQIMVRGTTENDQPLLPWRPGLDGSRTAIIPGSSFAGAVRSLHETIAGGCLRIFDRDYVPTYREVASPGSFNGLRMGLVSEADDEGRPSKMWLCSTIVWANAVELQRALPAGETLQTGLVLRMTGTASTHLGREFLGDLRGVASADPAAGNWLVLVADAGARESVTTFRIALGELPTRPSNVTVSETDWDTYRRCAFDSDDLRGVRKDERHLASLRATEAAYQPADVSGKLMAKVEWKRHSIGYRQRVRPWVRPGTVLWANGTGNRITRLRPAVLWRRPGHIAAGERVDTALHACTDPKSLCPSCRVFGSADVEKRGDDEAARQRSYAGHLRFTDLVTKKTKPNDGPIHTIAPLSSPRPGAGQFYLDNDGETFSPSRDEILRHWGGKADRKPRPLRGRKYYWLTTPANVKPGRDEARQHHSDKLTAKVRVFPNQTPFTGTVWFDGLTSAELGGVLVALQPNRLIQSASSHRPGPVCLPIGGGKPFGFGALGTTVVLERIDSADSRYGGGESPTISFDDAVRAFEASVPEGIKERVWPAVSAALTLDHVDRHRVWYPPGATWDVHGRGRDADLRRFDEGYEFWAQTQGQRLRKEPDRPLLALPEADAGAAAQYLTIIEKK
ncbi:MAG: hypothetical protein ACR2G2_07005 [Pseudonocardia sp.]